MLNDFSILSSGGYLVYWSGTILDILVGINLGNITVKFESHLPKIQEELAFIAKHSQFSFYSSGGHFVHRSGTVLAITLEGVLSNIPI